MVFVVGKRGSGYSYATPNHLAMADATGDSAVVEIQDGKVVTFYGREIQVLTKKVRSCERSEPRPEPFRNHFTDSGMLADAQSNRMTSNPSASAATLITRSAVARRSAPRCRAMLNRSFACGGLTSVHSRLDHQSGLHQWIASGELRKKCEVPIRRQEFFYAVGDANRGDPRVMDNRTAHPWALHEFFKHDQKILGFTQQLICWRPRPRFDLRPCLIRFGRSLFPDARVGHYAKKLV